MNTEILIIGGLHDGHRMLVPDNMHRIELINPPESPNGLMFQSVVSMVQTTTYEERSLADSEKEIYRVFVAQGTNAIQSLIEGYRRP